MLWPDGSPARKATKLRSSGNFAAAVSQEPGNDLYQFNLAVLRIRSDSPEKSEESRKVLERLSKVPGFRTGALRALLGDAVQHNDLERADTLAQDLQMSQQVTFSIIFFASNSIGN